jgi:tRNA-Thr(GGU) m(6)t(6)A37 methyltransferase TsaA
MKIELDPIGVIHSPHQKLEGMPIQPSRAQGIRGTVELDPRYSEGLQDLDAFSHIVLLYWLHKSSGYKLKVVPFLDTEERGLFATRAPRRPNPLGLSVVRLNSVDRPVLHVSDLDILDGTPLLDIKPYVPEFDHRTQVRTGWLADCRKDRILSDDRFV